MADGHPVQHKNKNKNKTCIQENQKDHDDFQWKKPGSKSPATCQNLSKTFRDKQHKIRANVQNQKTLYIAIW